MEYTLPHRLEGGFDGLYGLVLTEVGDGRMRGEVPVRDDVMQPFGLVHGGVYAAVAESLASIGTAVGVGHDKFVAGISNLTSFMRPITAGSIHALAEARHRGRTTWVWEVTMSDDAGRDCVLSRVTIAVRDAPGAPPQQPPAAA
jgi:1,4-dihydroxy-2-naphthoyl-CoA hydrolase